MKISIAMATYNGAKYLREQLDSFADQTRQPDELVVCDDGSSDATMEVLRQFEKSAPFRVKIYENVNNLGFAANFGNALSLCCGDIIFISDQDDVWFPEKVAIIEKVFLENSNAFLARSDMIIVDRNMESSGTTKLENVIAIGGKSSDFKTGCGMAIRKSLLPILLPIPTPLFTHDGWLGDVAQSIRGSLLVEKPLMYYRRHEENASGWLVSQARRLSPIDAFKIHGFKDSRRGWSDQRGRLREIEMRLIERELDVLRIITQEEMQQAIIRLRCQQDGLSKRIQLVTRARVMRFVPVVIMWMKGGYRQFAGWKSMLKDLVRP